MKKYLILALIAVMMFTQTVSAQTGDAGGDAGGDMECMDPIINSISINDEDATTAGYQVDPVLASECLDVVKCTAIPVEDCWAEGGQAHCQWDALGNYVGAARGTYCLDASLEPALCEFETTEPCDVNETCAFDENGQWVGNDKGGYTYDQDDGYKMGLKTVNVTVVLTSPQGLNEICNGGTVKMVIDNYNSQMTKEVTLLAQSCSPQATIGTWTGSFQMHYWEKPGWYTILVQAITCCGNATKQSMMFEYTGMDGLCIAPPARMMSYGKLTPDKTSYAIGDVIASNCVQCDIGSAPQTIRNIGNTLVNVEASSTDLACVSPECYDNAVPADNGNGYGRLWIDLGNGWKKLKTSPGEYLTMSAQDYCWDNVTTNCPNCGTIRQPIYGLPPGPHATNILNLRVDMPNVLAGSYKQTITLMPVEAAKCCQDHRESMWPSNIACITPPQCYETARYCMQIGVQQGLTCNQLIDEDGVYVNGVYNSPEQVCPGGINHEVLTP